jgi:hypothetical protein
MGDPDLGANSAKLFLRGPLVSWWFREINEQRPPDLPHGPIGAVV